MIFSILDSIYPVTNYTWNLIDRPSPAAAVHKKNRRTEKLKNKKTRQREVSDGLCKGTGSVAASTAGLHFTQVTASRD